jgi:hypothetical protein
MKHILLLGIYVSSCLAAYIPVIPLDDAEPLLRVEAIEFRERETPLSATREE